MFMSLIRERNKYIKSGNIFHFLLLGGILLLNVSPAFAMNFASIVQYATGNGPGTVIIDDINGDGITDIITLNTLSNSVSVLRGNGDGTFQAKIDYTAGTAPVFVRTADLNGDGKLDLVVANKDSNSISILLGNGNGTFQESVEIGTGSDPVYVTVDDINGDDIPDLVVANNTGASVSVLLGIGDGTFQDKQDHTVGGGPIIVKTTYLDGDINLDLIVVNSGSNTISVLLNNGDGTFQSRVYDTGVAPVSLNTDYFNSDDYIDLLVVNSGSNSVSVFVGNGNGTFQNGVNYATGNSPGPVKIEDLNGDGTLDLIIPNSASHTVSVLLGNEDVNVPGEGDGTFKSKVDYATGKNPRSVALGNLNGDGNRSMAVVNSDDNSISLFRGNADGTFNPKVDFATGGGPWPVIVADLNGDGKDDMIVANFLDNNVSVMVNTTMAEAQLTPALLDFGTVISGSSSSPQTITISNSGNVSLEVTGIVLSGSAPGQFSLSLGTCPSFTPTLTAGSSCTISVTFVPTSQGSKSAAIFLTSNDPTSPSRNIPLTGNGMAPVASAEPTAFVFGNQIIRSVSAPGVVTIRNSGETELVVSGIALAGADYSQFTLSLGTCPNLHPTINPGSSCTVSVAFSPGNAGKKSAELQIFSNDPVLPTLRLSLSGNGIVTLDTLKVKLLPTDNLYASIQDAYDAAASGDTIRAQNYTFPELLDFANTSISRITLSGGFDSSYQSVNGSTKVRKLIIRSGKLTVKGITIGQ